MVSVKISELSGAALDWAVAKCEGYQSSYLDPAKAASPLYKDDQHVWLDRLCYSSDWRLAGPIIEREGIDIFRFNGNETVWTAGIFRKDKGKEHRHAIEEDGPTPLIAAMRCYVASKADVDSVMVPEELI